MFLNLTRPKYKENLEKTRESIKKIHFGKVFDGDIDVSSPFLPFLLFFTFFIGSGLFLLLLTLVRKILKINYL